MIMAEMTKNEFLELFEPEVHDDLIAALERYPDAEGLVCFENLQMDSSSCGERTAVVVGPSNTFTLEKARTGHLNDLPSQRQYPRSFWRGADRGET
jgi:hypothetical protein